MAARLPHRSSSTRVNERRLYFILSFTDHRWLRRVYRIISWKLMMLAIIILWSCYKFITLIVNASEDNIGSVFVHELKVGAR